MSEAESRAGERERAEEVRHRHSGRLCQASDGAALHLYPSLSLRCGSLMSATARSHSWYIPQQRPSCVPIDAPNCIAENLCVLQQICSPSPSPPSPAQPTNHSAPPPLSPPRAPPSWPPVAPLPLAPPSPTPSSPPTLPRHPMPLPSEPPLHTPPPHIPPPAPPSQAVPLQGTAAALQNEESAPQPIDTSLVVGGALVGVLVTGLLLAAVIYAVARRHRRRADSKSLAIVEAPTLAEANGSRA